MTVHGMILHRIKVSARASFCPYLKEGLTYQHWQSSPHQQCLGPAGLPALPIGFDRDEPEEVTEVEEDVV